MPSRHLRLLALLATLLTALLTSSCGGGPAGPGQSAPALPDGAELLADSAAAMRTVTTTRAAIDVRGDLPGVPIKSAEGQLTREGTAKGTATVEMGDLVEVDFVIIGDDLYLRGPTGGFRKLSTSSAFLVYDPTVILDPDRGLASVLAAGTEAKTEAREQVSGVDSYRVRAKFPREKLRELVPGFNQDSTGQVWIAADGSRLVQAQLPTRTGAISLRFFDFDAPVDIIAPT
jgi:lipoprotein LprG